MLPINRLFVDQQIPRGVTGSATETRNNDAGT